MTREQPWSFVGPHDMGKPQTGGINLNRQCSDSRSFPPLRGRLQLQAAKAGSSHPPKCAGDLCAIFEGDRREVL